MAGPGALIEGTELRKRFQTGREVRTIVDCVTIRVDAGEFIAIRGPSGVGKTTLLHLLAGILPPEEGRVFWSGTDVYALSEPDRDRRRAREAGMVFQFHHLLPDLTVEENITLALSLAAVTKDTRGRTAELLGRLGLEAFACSRIDRLSGGERQKVAVARALAHRPKLIFADEPTGNLDDRSADSVLLLLEEARKTDGVAILLSTHNPQVAARADRVLELQSGRVPCPG